VLGCVMRRLSIVFPVVCASACVEVSRQHSVTLPSEDVTDLVAFVERGDWVFVGETDADQLTFDLNTRAAGATAKRAGRNEAAIDWSVYQGNGVAQATALTPALSASVDWWVSGPERLGLDVLAPEGNVAIQGSTGPLVLTASGIDLDRVSGDIDAYASQTGLRADLVPEIGDVVTLQAVDGDVWLALPQGTEMALEVFADPLWGMEVTNLGFDRYTSLPGYFSAEIGEGRTAITVIVENGGFVLLPEGEL